METYKKGEVPKGKVKSLESMLFIPHMHCIILESIMGDELTFMSKIECIS